MKIRPIKSEEIPLLTDFIYEAIYQDGSQEPLPRTVIQAPSIWIYIDRFGSRKDDDCLVAEVDGTIVGAVWVRCIKAFGYIDEGVPEFAFSVYPQYRGNGIGTALMQAMLAHLKGKKVKRASLAVQKGNPAARLYRRAGFQIVDETEQEYIMTYDFSE